MVGDVGSPLLMLDTPKGNLTDGDPTKDVVYGVLSFVTNSTGSCTASTLAAYTRVDRYAQWMRAVFSLKVLY